MQEHSPHQGIPSSISMQHPSLAMKRTRCCRIPSCQCHPRGCPTRTYTEWLSPTDMPNFQAQWRIPTQMRCSIYHSSQRSHPIHQFNHINPSSKHLPSRMMSGMMISRKVSPPHQYTSIHHFLFRPQWRQFKAMRRLILRRSRTMSSRRAPFKSGNGPMMISARSPHRSKNRPSPFNPHHTHPDLHLHLPQTPTAAASSKAIDISKASRPPAHPCPQILNSATFCMNTPIMSTES